MAIVFYFWDACWCSYFTLAEYSSSINQVHDPIKAYTLIPYITQEYRQHHKLRSSPAAWGVWVQSEIETLFYLWLDLNLGSCPTFCIPDHMAAPFRSSLWQTYKRKVWFFYCFLMPAINLNIFPGIFSEGFRDTLSLFYNPFYSVRKFEFR